MVGAGVGRGAAGPFPVAIAQGEEEYWYSLSDGMLVYGALPSAYYHVSSLIYWCWYPSELLCKVN